MFAGGKLKLRRAVLIVFLLVMSSVVIYTVKAAPEEVFAPNEFIIGVKEVNSRILFHIQRSGGIILEEISVLNAIRVKVPPSIENAFIKSIKSRPEVRYVERNIVFKAVHTPNDPYWDDQWGMRIIQADSAWDIHKGSTSVTVAIIDTGIEYTHDDLSDHCINLGYDWVNNDNDPMDDNGHGTHCAGVAAAIMDNGIGVVGVAQVSIMAEKVLDEEGSGYADDVADGIVHAVDAGADVISMSLGSYFSSNLIKDACQYAWDKGCILVAAAGNDNIQWRHYPAAYDTVIAVSATDKYDRKASYSNYGNWIELAAPGGDGEDYHDWILSTYLDNWYAWSCGTSMATPHVAGLAALVWSYEPTLTNQELRQHLRDTADDLGASGKDRYYGYGRINAYRALNELGPVDNPPTCSIVDPVDGQVISGVYRVKVDATDDNEVSMVELSIDGGSWIDITDNFDGTYYYYDWDTATVPDGSHTLDARATDSASQTTYADQVTVTVDNVPSENIMHVESIDMSKQTWWFLKRAVAVVTIFDADGNPVEGATVYGTWSGLTSESESGVTDSEGKVTFYTNWIWGKSGTCTFTVDDVVKTDWTYDPEANKETSDSITI